MRRLPTIAACGFAAILLCPRPASASTALRLSVRAAVLVEQSTGRRLYGVAPERELPIASATKLMTALVTLERVRLGTVFSEPDYHPAPADSQIGLVPGERMTVHDLLLALLLPSADDAAEDLAYNIGHGSVRRFVAIMNRRARELGLTRTHYSTPIGLDTPGNFSTASDLVKLAGHLLAHHPFFARVVALHRAVLHTGSHVRVVLNRNDLVGRVPWVNGVKTGHTIDAGYVLVASGRRNRMTLLSAVLGTASEAARDANTMALLDYGFSSFRLVRPVRAGAVIARTEVRDRPGEHAAVIAARGFRAVIARRQRVELRVELPRQLAAPLPRHAVVGSVVVLVARRPVARIPLLLARALPGATPLTLAAGFILRPAALVSLLVLLGASIAVVLWWRDRTGRSDERGAETA